LLPLATRFDHFGPLLSRPRSRHSALTVAPLGRGLTGGQRGRVGLSGAGLSLFFRVSRHGFARELGAAWCRPMRNARPPAPRRPPQHPTERRHGRPRHTPQQLLRQPLAQIRPIKTPPATTGRVWRPPFPEDHVPDPLPPRNPARMRQARAKAAPLASPHQSAPPAAAPRARGAAPRRKGGERHHPRPA